MPGCRVPVADQLPASVPVLVLARQAQGLVWSAWLL
jgi:hypothetical protein